MDRTTTSPPGGRTLTLEPYQQQAEEPLDVEPTTPPAPGRWGGLPPVGTRPIEDRLRWAGEILALFFLWLAIWAVYRYLRVVSGVDDTALGPLLSIIAPVVLTLGIPVLWWHYRLREPGLPFLLTRRNLFSSVLVGCIAVVLFFVFYYVSYPVLISIMGVRTGGELSFWALWKAESLAWLVATTLFYLVIVGPVEELYHRGFIQDQLNRVFAPILGIFVASVVFVLGHVPIDFMVNGITLETWGLRWISSFPFAMGMGVFYHWSRNIWGAAVYHGLYDWFLSVNNLEYGLLGPDLTLGQYYSLFAVWFIAEGVIIVLVAYAGYRLVWKRSRPAGSLGFKVIGVSEGEPRERFLVRTARFLETRRIVAFARRIDRAPGKGPEVWSFTVIGVVLLGNLALTGALGAVPEWGQGTGVGPGGSVTVDATKVLPLETEHEYIYEGQTMDFTYQTGTTRRYVSVELALTWTDEAPIDPRYENQPDTLKVELFFDDDGEYVLVASDTATGGPLDLDWTPQDIPRSDGLMVSVTAVECGNQVPFLNPLGLRERADGGNSFDLEVGITVVDEG